MKFLPHNLSARNLAILGMTVTTLLLVLVGGLQWRSGNDFRTSGEWTVHTRTVLLDLESLLTCTLDAETSQRGYLLTHKESYLDPYQHSLTSINDQVQTLRLLTSYNPKEKSDLDRLEILIKTKSDEMAQAVAMEKAENHAGALQIIDSGYSKSTMDKIRSTVRTMQDSETNLLHLRDEDYQRNSQINSELSVLMTLLGLGFTIAIISFFLLRRFEQMHELITICAWSRLIELEGEWLTVEEYLMRRFHARITHGISHAESVKVLKLLEFEKLREAAEAA